MKNSVLHTRISEELLEELKKQAKAENRTLSNLVETVLKDYLKK
jgi:predicted HicB family RNase H-like nuclease